MANYMFSIVEILHNTEIKKDSIGNGKRMASAIAIMCCFPHIVKKDESIPSQHVKSLLSMLRLMPSSHNKCTDWDTVSKLIPATMKRDAIEAVKAAIVTLSHREGLFQPEWLFALPDLHFLSETVQPFQPPEHNPRAIQWGDRVILLGRVRNFMEHSDHEIRYIAIISIDNHMLLSAIWQ